jgi:hypothetical protein
MRSKIYFLLSSSTILGGWRPAAVRPTFLIGSPYNDKRMLFIRIDPLSCTQPQIKVALTIFASQRHSLLVSVLGVQITLSFRLYNNRVRIFYTAGILVIICVLLRKILSFLFYALLYNKHFTTLFAPF